MNTNNELLIERTHFGVRVFKFDRGGARYLVSETNFKDKIISPVLKIETGDITITINKKQSNNEKE